STSARLFSLKRSRPSYTKVNLPTFGPRNAFYSFVATLLCFKSASRTQVTSINDDYNPIGAIMGEVIRFIPKSERERSRLTREARVIYSSVCPPAAPFNELDSKAPVAHAMSGGDKSESEVAGEPSERCV